MLALALLALALWLLARQFQFLAPQYETTQLSGRGCGRDAGSNISHRPQ